MRAATATADLRVLRNIEDNSERILADRNNDEDQRRNANQDDQQIAIADAACGEIILRLLRARGEIRKVFIA